MLCRAHVLSPIGRLAVIADEVGLVAICWDTETEGHDPAAHNPVLSKLGEVHEVEADEHPVLAAAARQLREYFDGLRTAFDLPLAARGTAFQQAAWEVLRGIPFGTTITYGEQARRLGDVKKSRAVGAANGQNPIPIVVPCHRVVGANGALTGFAGGVGVKAWLLDHERGQLQLPSEKQPG